MKVDLGVYELGDLGSSSSSDDDRLVFDWGKRESLEGFLFSDGEVGGERDFEDLDAFNGAGMRMQFWWKEPCTVSVS